MKTLYLVLALSLIFVLCEANNNTKECQNYEDKSGCVEKEYYDNRNLYSEIPYKNGKIDGIAKDYYDNRNLKSETSYKNGKIDGIVKYYNEDGNLALYITYENDEAISGECVNGKNISIELLLDSSDEEIMEFCSN